ncbi:hypothetical protein ST201phi2-1p414 [Pseudomonas phage 201phi2-1]|uniref:Uncharacterized protein n=1 Tax=Pseudomonas phage 201phi2-1 TaxID=198110 RepID=B3FJS3_BP201|nr:hypothetical protein ST201phi2-1p414 [Pseudomonas phage 201phi2-1]ABY63238.1 hypothetical protein 201phi2-1p414 [Pseudomonas phage 201phi2-1]
MSYALIGFLMTLSLILLIGWVGMGFKSKVDRVVHTRVGFALLFSVAITVYANLITLSVELAK